MIRAAIGLAMCIASIAGAQANDRARGVILGIVADSNLRPVAGADVGFAGYGVHIATDSLGRFRIVNVPPGKFILLARSIGYRPATSLVDIANDDTLRLSFTLEPTAAQQLATVVVTERTLSRKLQDFEERRKLGHGEFFTLADIQKINGLSMADVVRRAKAVRISWDGTTALAARETNKPPCPMAIYVDGIPLGAERLDYLPSPNLVAAVEVYAGSATLPVWLPRGPLGTRVGCGAILVWTRDGSEG